MYSITFFCHSLILSCLKIQMLIWQLHYLKLTFGFQAENTLAQTGLSWGYKRINRRARNRSGIGSCAAFSYQTSFSWKSHCASTHLQEFSPRKDELQFLLSHCLPVLRWCSAPPWALPSLNDAASTVYKKHRSPTLSSAPQHPALSTSHNWFVFPACFCHQGFI